MLATSDLASPAWIRPFYLFSQPSISSPPLARPELGHFFLAFPLICLPLLARFRSSELARL